MTRDPQTLVALLIVAVAVSVLLRRGVAWWRGTTTSGCSGGCSGCDVKPAATESRLKAPLPIIDVDSNKRAT